ncbi:unnamed protein product [Mycena citricolor]|uniref:5-oxoprolinase n=1 Tax=Mycena citricolor TaxID=2018698 RepID=A0AAD2K0T3_9AGAR|nr:unnamed protein product [Mycena citricolor]
MTEMQTKWRLGIDVGGTFTDGILYNPHTGRTYRTKIPSTPDNQARGVLSAVDRLRVLAKEEDVQEIEVDALHHGTTVATNALLEGTGARVALVTTEGFRDTLVLRRSQVPGGLGAWVVYPKQRPVVSLEMTIECPGRFAIDGSEVRPFDAEVFRERVQGLKQHNPEAFTVSLINSFANAAHEQAAAAVLAAEFPHVPIVLSSNVLPELMEYERTLTAVVSAMVRPRVSAYLMQLTAGLPTADIRILRSDGGLTSPALATEFSANLLYSGPAGGVAGVAALVARKCGYANLLTFDMGGTSTDVCLIQDGTPALRRETTVGDLTVRAPSVDVRTVGAGGGSVAHVPDVTRALRVGPESAGAVPGPAAYGQGGAKPTVTDANLLLGFLPPTLLSNTFPLSTAVAHAALAPLSTALSLSLLDTAAGIIALANETMFGALKSVSLERGLDPRAFSLVAFGGAGPTHVCALAQLLGSYPAIVPPSPGVLCAFGDAVVGLRHEVGRTCNGMTEARDVIDVCRHLAREAAAVLEKQGVAQERQSCSWEADMRYTGQAMSLPVVFHVDELVEKGMQIIQDRFTAHHNTQFTYTLPLPVELINLRARVEEIADPLILPVLPEREGDMDDALMGRTQMYWSGHTYTDAPIWDRAKLCAGDRLSGPGIISEMDANTLLLPDHRAEIDGWGNILIWPQETVYPPGQAVAGNISEEDKPQQDQKIVTQIVEAALANARLEMDGLIQRTALSPAMREQLDYFPMISAGEGPNEGKMVIGQFGSYIGHFLEIWTSTIDPGDVFITNDPYEVRGGISHLNDMLVMMPVYFGARRVGWVANQGHFTDVGGQTPGSLPINARSIFEDGIQIPLSKLYEGGKMNSALQNIIIRNSRTPSFSRADLHALVAACRIAGERITELCTRFGVDRFAYALDSLLARNRAAFAVLLKTKIPADVKMSFEDWMDDDGTGWGPWKVRCAMFKEVFVGENGVEEERLVYDFDGTDPQAESSVNWLLSPTTWKMRSSAYLIKALDPSITLNDGAYDLMDVRIPRGTLLNPVRPAGLSCRTHLLGRTLDLMIGTLGQRQPLMMTAAGYSDSPHFFYSGWQAGEWFQVYQIGFGGVPGRPVGDGLDGHSLFPSMKTVPNEYLELYYPLLVDRYALIPDSGGAGLHRGGNGVRIDYVFRAPGEVSLHDDRWLTKPWGVNGGLPGARSSKVLVRKSDGARVALKSKADHVRVEPGDVLEWCTWGGGGWGAPELRSAELVAREVREGLITPAGARHYGVQLTPTGAVDLAPTTAARAQMAAAREGRAGVFEIDRGGSLRELFERCLDETGLPPPRLPSARTLRGPVAMMPDVLALHRRRQEEDREEFGEEAYERYAAAGLHGEETMRGGDRGCC